MIPNVLETLSVIKRVLERERVCKRMRHPRRSGDKGVRALQTCTLALMSEEIPKAPES